MLWNDLPYVRWAGIDITLAAPRDADSPFISIGGILPIWRSSLHFARLMRLLCDIFGSSRDSFVASG